jgi:hypothetical protein
MTEHGDDAAHCSNGLTAQTFREATGEERATYRRWVRGTVVFYSALCLMVVALAWTSYASVSRTQVTSLSTPVPAQGLDLR